MSSLRVVQPTLQPGATPRTGIFVSYSHDDLEAFAKPFYNHLKAMVRNRGGLGFTPADIFFDREGLKAGDEWHERIQAALERSRVLIFLISVSSIGSEFCMNKELAHGFQAGASVRIFLVLIRSCQWVGIPAPSDPQNRRLGDLEVVPRQPFGREDLVPIERWNSLDDANDQAVLQIAEALAGTLPGTRHIDPPKVVRPDTVLRRQIPYRCNQQHVVAEFSTGLGRWAHKSTEPAVSQALAVFFKGLAEDHLPQFWARLRNRELVDWVGVKRGHTIRDDKPLALPLGTSGGPQGGLRPDVLRSLSNALTDNAYKIDSVDALSGFLRGSKAMCPLSVILPSEDPKKWIDSLRGLFALLEECPVDTPLHWLVFAFCLEGRSRAEGGLFRRWLGGYRASKPEGQGDFLSPVLSKLQRTVVVLTSPLDPLEKDDIRQWYHNEKFEAFVDDDADTLVKNVLRDQLSLRYAAFVERLQSYYPILK
ncbi:MAG: toll/interleukin-1 receptor domain-containing protein [Verrucomicrobiales bacterium]|nr:toll/interleukin-1 receptor domain-containing protein [Verrucomicrobiales bacterium]